MLSVKIDFLPESAAKYRAGYAVVVVDVVRATTTAITAASTGRRCFPVATVAEALALAPLLNNPVLAGEQAGLVPHGFELNNSPAALAELGSIERPLILLSSAGTKLCRNAAVCDKVQLACLRNVEATAIDLANRACKVVLIGAGTRGEFREEDAMCCAWIAERLFDLGYRPDDQETMKYVRRWRGAPSSAWTTGKSAAYLRRSGQLRDLEFVLSHIDDLQSAFPLRDGEVFVEPVCSLKTPVVAQDMISA